MADDLLVARGLVVAYGRPAAMFARRSVAPAVLYGIDIHVGKGETVGIVGESGSGKTTLGRALLGLVKPVAGSVIFDGRDITALDEKTRRPLRRRMQMIFQDPMSSLNPRHTIGRILTESVLLHGLAQDHRNRLERAASKRDCVYFLAEESPQGSLARCAEHRIGSRSLHPQRS